MAQDCRHKTTSFSFGDFAAVIIAVSILTLMAILYTPQAALYKPLPHLTSPLTPFHLPVYDRCQIISPGPSFQQSCKEGNPPYSQ